MIAKEDGLSTTEQIPRVMGVSEAAAFLGIKKSNTRKFLERRGVVPYAELALGPVWDLPTLERVRAEYEADSGKVDADRRRRSSALGTGDVPAVVRLSAPQRDILRQLLAGPSRPGANPWGMTHQALERLRVRGFVEIVGDNYGLTDLGRDAVSSLGGK